ncbi:MAG: LysR substrate-binding domain-containing protein [Anaeromyxobacter sp.]
MSPPSSPAQAPGARPDPSAPPALSLLGAAVRYGAVTALAPLDLALRAGERVAIVGPSGAGKTTLLKLLNTTLAPTEGTVAVLGEEPALLSARALRRLRARIGTVHQQLHLVPQATVFQNVVAGRLGRATLAGALAALLSRREAAAVRALLAEVGIPEKLHERLDRLSGGEQQRVAIVRTLHQAPELVLADEPLSAVDPERASELAALLARAYAGRTLVVSTHRIEPLLPHVDRVIGLRRGELAFDLPAERVRLADLSRVYRSERAEAGPGSGARARAGGAPAAGAVEPAGLLTLAASSTPAETVVPPALRRFVRLYPNVRLHLVQGGSAAVEAAVREGKAELGFVGARPLADGLEQTLVADDEIIAAAAPALDLGPLPLALEDLARAPRVEREAGSGTRAVLEDHLRGLGVTLPPAVLEAEGLAALRAAAISGVGLAFVSRRAVADDLATGLLRVVPVAGLEIPRHVFAIHRPAPSPAARAFLEVARACAGAPGSEP